MDNRISVIRYVGVTVSKGSLLVTLYLHIYESVLLPLDRMCCIRRARDFQGHRSEVKDSWCMVFPMRPFFLFVVLRVEDSA